MCFLFVAEPERDHRGADLGLQQRHRGGVPQHVSGDLLGAERRAALGGGGGVFVMSHSTASWLSRPPRFEGNSGSSGWP